MHYIFWDFDGTLSYYEYGYFSGTVLKAMDELCPGHGLTRDVLHPLISLCPWHLWQAPHTRMNGRPALWWANMERVFTEALWECGVEPRLAKRAAKRAHELYADPARHLLFPDAVPAMRMLHEAGLTQCILSNHVPELEDCLRQMPIAPYISHCINSAHVGYEKAHPGLFDYALRVTGADPSHCYMIGDNIQADVAGGEAAGMNCILVRKPPKGRDARFAPDLIAAVGLILTDLAEAVDANG